MRVYSSESNSTKCSLNSTTNPALCVAQNWNLPEWLKSYSFKSGSAKSNIKLTQSSLVKIWYNPVRHKFDWTNCGSNLTQQSMDQNLFTWIWLKQVWLISDATKFESNLIYLNLTQLDAAQIWQPNLLHVWLKYGLFKSGSAKSDKKSTQLSVVEIWYNQVRWKSDSTKSVSNFHLLEQCATLIETFISKTYFYLLYLKSDFYCHQHNLISALSLGLDTAV